MSTESESIELPSALIEELKRQDKAVAVLTPAVDRQVSEAASAYFAPRPERSRPTARRWALTGTLAASQLVGVFLARMQSELEPDMLANDIDGSGVVDILDAFALARMAGGSGQAPQAEIDALILEIVALNGASP